MTAPDPDTVTETPSEFAKRWLQLTSKASHLKSPLCPESYHERYADLDQRDWCCDQADLAAMVEARDATLADPADRDVKARLIAHRNVLRRMDRAEADVTELRATVERVRALHTRCHTPGWPDTCDEEDFDWPCRTIRALDGAGEQ